MELRYARFQAFTQLMRPLSAWARRKRMEQMLRLANVTDGMSVLDLGGTARSWNHPSWRWISSSRESLWKRLPRVVQRRPHSALGNRSPAEYLDGPTPGTTALRFSSNVRTQIPTNLRGSAVHWRSSKHRSAKRFPGKDEPSFRR